MERKNTNLFFVSGIFLLFILLYLGKSSKETEETFLDNDRKQSRKNATIQPSQKLWIKNVSLSEKALPEAR